jgi:hypothetical protein
MADALKRFIETFIRQRVAGAGTHIASTPARRGPSARALWPN